LTAFGGIEVCHFPGTIIPRLLAAHPVVTLYDLCWVHYPHCYPRRELELLWTVVIPSLRRAAAVVVPSQQTKADCLAVMNLNEDRVVVTPLAPRTALASPGRDKPTARQDLGLPRPYVLDVGSICRRKNQLRLLAAMDLLRKQKRLHFDLLLVGPNGLGAEEVLSLRSQLQLERHVHIRGYLAEADLLRLYHAAEALVFPSLCEGFGLPILEAMACGTAVITSNIPALREAAGDAAQYCEPTNVESIADALRRVMEDDDHRASLAQKGLQRIKSFTWEAAATKTLQAYRLALTR